MKKKYPLIIGIALGLAACVGVAIAAGGTSSDPLISLNYIRGTYLPDLLSKAQDRIETDTSPVYQTALGRLNQVVGQAKSGQTNGSYMLANQFVPVRLKKGDAVTGITGTSVVLLAGEGKLAFSSGAVVNVTDGATVKSGGFLSSGKRYLTAENTKACYTVASDTAVISIQGYYSMAYSTETDYNMLAGALNTMGLLKGKDLGYGSGYALEDKATRIEGLLMFLRLLGQENAAEAYKGSQPFTDVPDWAASYVAYAYSKGYTKGISGKLFGSTNLIGTSEYTTFLLRALGYSDAANGDFTWNDALEKAKHFGVLTSGETAFFQKSTFNRAQMTYLSYYSLSANMKSGGGTLLDGLVAAGAVDAAEAQSAMSKVSSSRIS
ncbi:MAG: hypothetical protein PHT34_07650 [Oscillospiraceae bacterium]|mgnify:CR=1 FL=1|nr:hypothetical protein [Oscillospiraceae bacterium]